MAWRKHLLQAYSVRSNFVQTTEYVYGVFVEHINATSRQIGGLYRYSVPQELGFGSSCKKVRTKKITMTSRRYL